MRILKGVYPLKDRRLRLVLPRDIEFGETPVWVRLVGDNGLGKSSFIEKVLIPGLKKQKVPFLYLGQDFRTQLYTLKAFLAVFHKTRVREDIPGLLDQWVGHHRHARVFIMDEFDKFPAHTEHAFRISRDFIRTYVAVSHARRPLEPGPPFEERILNFRKNPIENSILEVTVESPEP
jgi:hypothetical protein